MKTIGRIKQLWRYPVKSMMGETVDSAYIEQGGLRGDRCWAVRDETANELTVVRKLPKLLLCRASYTAEPAGAGVPEVRVTFPDGSALASGEESLDAALSELLGRTVSLWPLQPRSNWRHYRLAGMNGAREMKRQFAARQLPDFSSIPLRRVVELMFFVTPVGRYYDVFPLHVLTTSALARMRELEPRGDFRVERFRPNILLETGSDNADFAEFSWLGGELHIGDAVIRCESRTVRCSAPAQPQHDIDKDSKVIRAMEKHTDRHLGINATVIRPGEIRAGDEVGWKPGRSKSGALNTAMGRLKNRVIHGGLLAVDKLNRRG